MVRINWEDFSRYLLVERKLDIKNLPSYKCQCGFISEYFADKEFTRENLNLFLNELRLKQKSNSTLNNYIKILKHIDRFLGKKEMFEYTYFPKSYKKQRLLTPEEVQKIIETPIKYLKHTGPIKMKGLEKRIRIAIYFLSVTGLRINELCTLKWTDVTPEVITIRAENAKNKKERQVPIATETYDMLKTLTEFTNDYVFGYKYEKGEGRMNRNLINNAIKVKAKNAHIEGYQDLHAHLFRHYFATEKIKLFPIDRVSKILGHSDVGITSKIYCHYDMSMLREVVDKKAPDTDNSRLDSLEKRLSGIEGLLEKLLDQKKE